MQTFFTITAVVLLMSYGVVSVATSETVRSLGPRLVDFRDRLRGAWNRQPLLVRALLGFTAAIGLFRLLGLGAGFMVLGSALAVLVGFVMLWLREFRFLIDLRDDDFPGHSDKLLWGLFLIIMAPVSLWVFRSYHQARWPEPGRKSTTANVRSDLV